MWAFLAIYKGEKAWIRVVFSHWMKLSEKLGVCKKENDTWNGALLFSPTAMVQQAA